MRMNLLEKFIHSRAGGISSDEWTNTVVPVLYIVILLRVCMHIPVGRRILPVQCISNCLRCAWRRGEGVSTLWYISPIYSDCRLLNVSEVSVYNSSLPVRVTAGSLEHLYLTTPKVIFKGRPPQHFNEYQNNFQTRLCWHFLVEFAFSSNYFFQNLICTV